MALMIALKIVRVALGILCAGVVLGASYHGQAVIIDTDLMTDVDDVGALAIANVLHNCGLADLRGVAINTRSRYGALAASVRSDSPDKL